MKKKSKERLLAGDKDCKEKSKCRETIEEKIDFRQELPPVVEELVHSCGDERCFDHVSEEPIPHRGAIIDLLDRVILVLYPGYFLRGRLDRVNLQYYLGEQVTGLYDAFSQQITLALRHECIRLNKPCVHCETLGQKLAMEFVKKLPELRLRLAKDVRAAYDGDPAAKSYDEIIFSYPGIYAITVYRIAHELHKLEIPLIPRIMAEHAHSKTGIDIHPAAHIGESFFIDHGTGVVIGETCVIGHRVRIYQGVTLGALSLSKTEVEKLRQKKRHPTIEDDVIIYANATILGGETVVGARSVIGGNVWLTHSVPPDTEVYICVENRYKRNVAQRRRQEMERRKLIEG